MFVTGNCGVVGHRSPGPGLWFLIALALLVGACSNQETPVFAEPEVQVLLEKAQESLIALDFERALALTDSAEARQPRLPDVFFMRGRVYSEMMRYEDAEKAYKRTLKLNPEYPGVYNNLGNNAVRQERFRDGLALYRKELALASSPIPWRGIGQTYVELGVSDSARIAFNEALALDSSYTAVYTDMAQLLIDDGDFKEALRYAERALILQPDDLTSIYLAGNLYNLLGRNEEAIPLLARAIERWPWHGPSYNAFGQVLVRMGRKEEGEAVLKRAEALRALDAKISQMEGTVKNVPSDPFAHAGLGTLLRRAGRYNDAMHAYRVALSLEPKNLEFRNNIAAIELIRGDTLGAINWYRSALALDPTFKDSSSTDILLNLGVVYAISGDMEQATQAWRTVLRVRPNQPDARRYLARASSDMKPVAFEKRP